MTSQNIIYSPHWSLKEAARVFIESFQDKGTQRSYTHNFHQIFRQGILLEEQTLEEFGYVNKEVILDQIKETLKNGHDSSKLAAELTRQNRAAFFLSFTGFLERISSGKIKKALIQKHGANRTFIKIRHKTVASILTKEQLTSFWEELKRVNIERFLFSFLQYHGCRRVSEVGQLETKDVLLNEKRVVFHVLKKGRVVADLISVYLPTEIMTLLKELILNREKMSKKIVKTKEGQNMLQKDFVFGYRDQRKREVIIDYTRPIETSNINAWYKAAWKAMNSKSLEVFTPKQITHCLRATKISDLFNNGERLDRIQELTGHAHLDMLNYYNKPREEKNASQNFSILPSLDFLTTS